MTLPAHTPKRILCVCLGNICRSPTAEVVFRQNLAISGLNIAVDSAGTSSHHVGDKPDTRSCQHAKARGYSLSKCRARQISGQDFLDFDLILAMDEANLTNIKKLKQTTQNDKPYATLAKVALFSEHDPKYAGEPLPDPYYGGDTGFERVLDQCESSVGAWISHWQSDFD